MVGSQYLGVPRVSLSPSPPPPQFLFEKNPFPFVFTTKLQILRWNLSCKHSRCWNFIRRKSTSSGSCMIVIGNIFCPSRCSHFVGLSSSPTLIVHPTGKVFFKVTGWLHDDIIWAGLVQFVENLARCTLMDRLLLCDLVSSYIFPWAHTGPDISIYRTGVDGVRSCLATKPISTSYRAFAFSFDHFFFSRYLCLNLPISFLNGDCVTFFT